MNENLPTNVQLDTNQNGSVSFATDVITTIAALAANEVEGVASMYGGSGSLADILTRRGQSSRNLTRGVRVDMTDNQLSVLISIIIDYGSPVPEVARNIQENVKKAIETMSGLTVANVDVHVQGVSFERENRAAAEIEQQQRVLLQKRQDGEYAAQTPEPEKEEAPSAGPQADCGLDEDGGAGQPEDGCEPEPVDEDAR